MKPPTSNHFQLLRASFLTLFLFSLLLHSLLHFNTTTLFTFLSQNLTLTFLSFSLISLTSLSIFFFCRPLPVFLLDYALFKPAFDRKCTYEVCEYFIRRSRGYTLKSEEFMRSIYLKSGLGNETYGPPFMFESSDHEVAKLKSAVQEVEEGVLSSCDLVFSKTNMSPSDIDIVIVTCGVFAPIPSLTSLVVNRYKLKPDVKTYNLSGMGCSSGVMSLDLAAKIIRNCKKPRYALVIATESTSLNWYFGDNRSMLVTNCIFRVGCAAAIVSNDPACRSLAKMELVNSLRTHHGADDRSYRAAIQEEDEMGNPGIALTKDLIRVAGLGLREHIRSLAPRVFPLSQLVSYTYTIALSVFSGGNSKPVVPDFSTAFDHMCVHTGGKAVIEEVGRVMRLSDELTEPARMCLHRFGNTSSSLVFYELAYFEAKERIKKGDKVWMLAFGTGFKVCSLVLKSLRDLKMEADNPWKDCIHRYPIKNW